MTHGIDRITNWLEGIPREEFAALQHTTEYHAFINAFKYLEIAHQVQVSNEREIPSTYGSASISHTDPVSTLVFVTPPTIDIFGTGTMQRRMQGGRRRNCIGRRRDLRET